MAIPAKIAIDAEFVVTDDDAEAYLFTLVTKVEEAVRIALAEQFQLGMLSEPKLVTSANVNPSKLI